MERFRIDVATSYIEEDDITVVWNDLIFGDECIQRSLVGWYHGEPDARSTATFGTSTLNGTYLF